LSLDVLSEEPIASTALSFEQIPTRPERFAHASHMNVKRIFHNDGARPDAVHQLVLRDEFAGRFDQNFDYLERAPAKGYWRAKNAKLTASKVNLALA
jgi:hypothetical protein